MSDAQLLAAVFEGLKRSRGQWAIVVPEAFRPVALTPSTLPQPHSNESREDFLHRRRVFAALGSAPPDKAPNGLLGQLVGKDTWEKFQQRRHECDCRYCLATDLATLDSPHEQDWARRKVIRHAQFKIDFNPDTFITKVSVSDFVVQMPRTWAQELAKNAHPTQWATAVPNFFLKSSPAKRDGSGWYEAPAWDSTQGGALYEVTHWEWNEGMSAEVHNILEFANVSTDSGIYYDYSLRECLRSNMGVTWEEGGLDIDEGFYKLAISELGSATSSRKAENQQASKWTGDDDVLVTIAAEKSVRYTAPSISPAEIGTVLNLMAPATVSMLMRRLVLEAANPPATDAVAAA